ncbi:MAG: SPASM domain-containing protein [Planctomycetota bacterium]|nr:SPASM domain-containing protein [Planctomycetota bacterium]
MPKTLGLFQADLSSNGIGLRSRLLEPLLAGKPLIRRIVEGIAACKSISRAAVVVEPKDAALIADALRGTDCRVIESALPDVPLRSIWRRARKWALNGWAGGIGDTFLFAEEGNPFAMSFAAEKEGADIVVKFSAMSPFVDREMVDAMVAELIEKKEAANLLHSAAPPGFSYEIYSRKILELMARAGTTLQDFLQFRPTPGGAPGLDPTVTQSFFLLPAETASANYRFMVDSRRGIELVSSLIERRGVEVLSAPCLETIRFLDTQPDLWAGRIPCEVDFEFGDGSAGPQRAAVLEGLVDELVEFDDVRLSIDLPDNATGLDELGRLLTKARSAGIYGLHVGAHATAVSPGLLARCVEAKVDVISVRLSRDPDSGPGSDVESHTKVIENARAMIEQAKNSGGSAPFIVPEFVVTRDNWHEQESFFDSWFPGTGHVVFRVFDDRAGAVEDRAVMHLAPGRRRVCRKIMDRLYVRSNGDVPVCCVDSDSGRALGSAGRAPLASMWQSRTLSDLRRAHAAGDFTTFPLCAKCNSWAE